ncbi:Aste57867_4000 [Aphanomyces stellatus]|uniref:Aste57867_4000 protein n=1 Tax=Aphanomyces stellatus TaxID=120398 RepID=A0A485KG38_9STRA|nr:hypothetical protein As57867_003989 [Aphanomyces stellatus]VFT81135.1 Aste57867_4000 [Aphanomyces stellatus]
MRFHLLALASAMGLGFYMRSPPPSMTNAVLGPLNSTSISFTIAAPATSPFVMASLPTSTSAAPMPIEVTTTLPSLPPSLEPPSSSSSSPILKAQSVIPSSSASSTTGTWVALVAAVGSCGVVGGVWLYWRRKRTASTVMMGEFDPPSLQMDCSILDDDVVDSLDDDDGQDVTQYSL